MTDEERANSIVYSYARTFGDAEWAPYLKQDIINALAAVRDEERAAAADGLMGRVKAAKARIADLERLLEGARGQLKAQQGNAAEEARQMGDRIAELERERDEAQRRLRIELGLGQEWHQRATEAEARLAQVQETVRFIHALARTDTGGGDG